MSRPSRHCVCSWCGKPFDRGYAMNATRVANPQFCCHECLAAFWTKRAFAKFQERFWSNVEVGSPEECWPWRGRRNGRGYGKCQNFQHTFDSTASRIAYQLCYGPLPKNLGVCHDCDNPPCCNPLHLFPGTMKENMADCIAKGRFKYFKVRRGNEVNTSKLTADQALAIYSSAESGPVLAARYGISKEAVNHIKRGKNWAHVTRGSHAP